MARAPGYRPSIDDWLAAARDVRAAVREGAPSLGIPTWFYGHEPSNLFATAVAKYFRNALREGVRQMLAWEPSGIILSHGACYRTDAATEIKRAFGLTR